MLKYRFTTVLGIFLKWLFKTGPKGAFSHVKHFVALDNQKIDVTISEEQRESEENFPFKNKSVTLFSTLHEHLQDRKKAPH